MTRVTLVGPNTEGKLQSALDSVMETTQDFTDSAYTSHENRERILMMSDRLRQELQVLLRVGINLVSRSEFMRISFFSRSEFISLSCK